MPRNFGILHVYSPSQKAFEEFIADVPRFDVELLAEAKLRRYLQIG